MLYRSNGRYRGDLEQLFEHIAASCVLWMTSPVFSYQIEKEEHDAMERTSMRKSMQFFQTLFEAESDGQVLMREEAKEEEDGGGEILERARSVWRYTPIITLFNKCDLFRIDMESSWDETKTALLSFPEYDGPQSYEAITAYLKVMFSSMKIAQKRPFHIYETIAIDEERVSTVVHHIQTVTNLYTTNRRLDVQCNLVTSGHAQSVSNV